MYECKYGAKDMSFCMKCRKNQRLSKGNFI